MQGAGAPGKPLDTGHWLQVATTVHILIAKFVSSVVGPGKGRNLVMLPKIPAAYHALCGENTKTRLYQEGRRGIWAEEK